MTHALLIHNSCFRCKINKFISFSGKKRWKTCEKLKNNDVDIPHRYLDYRISTFFSLRFPQSYPHFFIPDFLPFPYRAGYSKDTSLFLWQQHR